MDTYDIAEEMVAAAELDVLAPTPSGEQDRLEALRREIASLN